MSEERHQEHPSGLELERLAVGEGDVAKAVSGHVETCAACRDYVARLRAGAERFAGDRAVGPFLDGVLQRAEPSNVVPIGLLRSRLLLGAAPLVAAAAVLLMLRARAVPVTPQGDRAPTTDTPGETTFKGGMALAVVREREGVQERLVGDVDVRPFDRIRLELALEGTRPIAAGVLADDGTWGNLIAPAFLDGGTHFSELSVRFDATPRDGWIVVGDPADVARVRTDVGSVSRGEVPSTLRVLRLRAAK